MITLLACDRFIIDANVIVSLIFIVNFCPVNATGQKFAVLSFSENFTNYWEQDVKFRCKDHNYISGLFSHFNKTTADRNWRVECCSSPGVELFVSII